MGGRPYHPAVDLERVYLRRRPYRLDDRSGRPLRRDGAGHPVGQKRPQLVLGGDQRRAHPQQGRLLKEGPGEDVLTRLHVDLLAGLAHQPVVGADAVRLGVEAGDHRDVVDVGHRGHHAPAHRGESTAAEVVQIRRLAGGQVFRVQPVYADNYRCHVNALPYRRGTLRRLAPQTTMTQSWRSRKMSYPT